MQEKPSPRIAMLSRRARRLMLLAWAPLLPIALVVLLGQLQPWLDAAATRWASEHWWALLLLATPMPLLLAFGARWWLRCPACRYRLARAGIRPENLICATSSGLHHCPSCGVDWREIAERKRAE